MSARALTHLPISGGPAGLDAVLPALRAALAGQGPALALTPLESTPSQHGQRLLAALAPGESLESDDVALVIGTSGSTGHPRGVLLTSELLRRSAAVSLARIGGPGRWVVALPLHHIGGVMTLVRSIEAGLGPVADASLGGVTRFEPAAFVEATADALAQSKADGARLYTSLVPTQLARLSSHAEGLRALAAYDAVLAGAAATPPDLLSLLRESGVNVVVSYGMTETCGGCVYDGVPLDGVEISLAEVTDDVGRIVVGGSIVAPGYRRDPDLTREFFRTDGFRTGDRGRFGPGDVLDVLGRLDDIVQIGGEGVSVAAVEDAVRSVDGVADVVVVAVDDAEWGSRLFAYVTSDVAERSADRIDEARLIEEVRLHVAGSLGRRAVPEVIVLDAFPLLAAGKVDRAALRESATASNASR